MRRLAVVPVLVGLLGCTDPAPVAANQVFTLTSPCQSDAGAYDAAACVGDGVNQILVQVCLAPAVAIPAAGLAATVQISAGTWDDPAAPATPTVLTAQLPMTSTGCVSEPFVAPATLGPVHVDAELLGYVQSLELTLTPASLTSVEVVPSVSLGAAMDAGTDIVITATVRAENGGIPTAGTTLAFTVSPADGGSIYPATTVLGTASATTGAGSATATLIVSGSPTTLTVTVKATPPTSAGAPTSATGTAILGG